MTSNKKESTEPESNNNPVEGTVEETPEANNNPALVQRRVDEQEKVEDHDVIRNDSLARRPTTIDDL